MIDVKVPDIGDFKDVEVIEVLVKPGDRVEKETSLITLESDKATIEIPSPQAGTVKELRVKLGDKVSQGSPVLVLEESPGAAAASPAKPAPTPAAAAPAPAKSASPAPAAAAFKGAADVTCDVLVLGSGPGGYSAAFRAADLGLATVLIERYPALGGVCLNVGCIPSKSLLHTAAIMDEARAMAAHGVIFAEPAIDMDKLREFKNKVVGKLSSGIAGMAKMRKVTVLTGVGSFAGPNHMAVETKEGRKIVAFKNAIIAAGSQSVKLRLNGNELPEDPRIVDSTGALELRSKPKRLLVIGGGIIGLEMGTVYSTLGARLDVVEMLDGLMTGADRDLVKVWQTFNARRFDNVMLKTKTTKVEASKEGLKVTFEGAEDTPTLRHDPVLGGPHAERQEDRRRSRRGCGQRTRLYPGRLANAHQRAAHFCDRRHRRSAHARSQGGARGARRRGGRRWPEILLRCARDSFGRLHRSRDRLGGTH
jgi:dihydrolipoamide dehydrogenase